MFGDQTGYYHYMIVTALISFVWFEHGFAQIEMQEPECTSP